MASTPQKPDISDALFMRVAVERRFAKLGELRECLNLMNPKSGDKPPISIVRRRRGLLTRDDIDSIEAIARSGEIVVRQIERYDLITKVGEGGMGAVYAVVDPDTRTGIDGDPFDARALAVRPEAAPPMPPL